MLTFHGKQELKDQRIAQVRAHRLADQLVHGQYWQDGKGCAVGCTIHSDNHFAYEGELGVPVELAYLALETERHSIDPVECCRFCGCSEEEPCIILVREDDDGKFSLARCQEEATAPIPCSWFLPAVCSAPTCIEKLIAESRNRVLLFDAQGRPA